MPKFPGLAPAQIERLDDLHKELGHVLAAVDLLVTKGEINSRVIEDHATKKMHKLGLYLHHQEVEE